MEARVAEWSKAPDLGSGLARGVGSNPTGHIFFCLSFSSFCFVVVIVRRAAEDARELVHALVALAVTAVTAAAVSKEGGTGKGVAGVALGLEVLGERERGARACRRCGGNPRRGYRPEP